MAPPKRWARRSSVGVLVHRPEHTIDSLLMSRETYTCPEKHTRFGDRWPRAADRCAAALRAL